MKNLFFILLSFLTLFTSNIFSQTIQLGSGTATNGTYTSSPVNIWYRRTVAQFVYTAAELNAAGISGPCDLQDLGWFVTQSPIYNLPGYTVKVKHVTANNVSAALGTTGWTTIKGPFTYNPTAGGWDMLGLDNTFSWNGTDNIGVEVCWSQVSPSYSSSGQCRIYSTSSGYRYSWTDGAGSSCGSTPFTTNTNKPQVQMVWSCGPPCTTPSPPSVLGVTVNCGDPATLTASGAPGNGDYIWYSDVNGNNQVGTGSSFTTPSLNGNTTYYVSTFVPANCESSLTPVTVNVNSNISAPSSNNININCGDPATLTASGSTGNYEWFSDANGSNSIGTGNSISLGNLYADSTVYVTATSASSSSGTFTYQTPIQQCSSTGCDLSFSIPGTPIGAVTAASIQVFSRGDFSSSTEYFTVNFEGNNLGTAQSGFDCQSTFTQENFTATPAQINVWAANGSIDVLLNSSTAVNVCSPYFEAYLVITYNYQQPGCISNLVPVTAIVNPTPGPTVSGNTPLCGSGSLTLTANGSGNPIEWYSDPGGTNLIANGSTFTTPTLTNNITYYVQEAAASTNQTFTYTSPVSSTNTTGGSVSINIPATPPNSTNGTLTVYLIGDLNSWNETVTIGSETGNLGTVFTGSQCSSTYWNTTYNITTNDLNTWTANGSVDLNFQASNGVNSICSGGTAFEVYVVLTYDYSSGSSCTSALTPVNVTIDQPSIVATGVSGIGSTCLGSTSTLTVQGGTLNGTSNWQWFSGSCNGTPVGTGTSITVTPTTTTTYYVSASANGACPATTCASGTVTLPTQINQLSINNSTSTCIVNDNNFVHFLDANGRLIASINSQGQNLGNVTATSFVENTPLLVQDCAGTISTSVLDRHWLIQPTVTNPGSPVIVRLPINNTELNSLITESNNNTNTIDDVNGLTDIYLSKYSGPSNLDNDFVNNCPGNGGNGNTQIYPQVTNGILNNIGLFANYPASDFYIEFVIPNFSEFWLHGSNIASPLPVTLTSLTTECDDGITLVKWETASEQNSDYFQIESSTDGLEWSEIAKVQAMGNSNTTKSYKFYDTKSVNGSYYRLKQVDFDGKFEYFGPISSHLCIDKENMINIFPNPNNGFFNIEISSNNNNPNSYIQIIDNKGRIIIDQKIEIKKGINLFNFSNIDLKSGIYTINIISDVDPYYEQKIVVIK